MRSDRAGGPTPPRRELVAAAVARLQGGDRPRARRAARTELARLAPSAAEWAEQLPALLDLARGDDGPSVALAQRALGALDDVGLVPLGDLLEASASILRRPGRGTARTALARLGVVARRDLAADDVVTLLLAASAAFDHPAIDVAERALELVGGRVAEVPDGVRQRLAGLAAALDPALRARSRTLLGAATTDGSKVDGADRAPTAPRGTWPVRDAAPADVVDLLSGRSATVVAAAWGLAAVVHLASTDPAALRDAARGLRDRDLGGGEVRAPARRLVRTLRSLRSGTDDDPGPIGAVVAFLARLVRGDDAGDGSGPADDPLPPHLARLGEVARLLVSHPVPMLTATPSRTDGTIDADVLVERLRRVAHAHREPWPLDLEQALLRVTVPAGEVDLRRAVADAAAVGSAAGDRLARWLAGGGLVEPRFVAVRVGSHVASAGGGPSRAWWAASPQAPARGPEQLGPLASALLDPGPTAEPTGRHRAGPPSRDVDWLALLPLPHHPELHAAWLLPHVSRHRDATLGETERTLTSVDGRVGDVVGAVLAHQMLGTSQARDAATTVALHLTGRGQPWGAAAGSSLAELGATPGEVLARAVGPLRAIAAGGGACEVLVLLVTALPPLARSGARGLPDLLALASALVVEHGRPEHAGPELSRALEAIAVGDSRTAVEARRLASQMTVNNATTRQNTG